MLVCTTYPIWYHFLFAEPNPLDPLNKEAANLMRSDEAKFKQNVGPVPRGGTVDGKSMLDKCNLYVVN
eukprot:TRINITY_DN15843_c0_g1_i1.p1 TRINITY_DN15843_c0_g1~~TRINITY_DN15843_c0_g1_i1.p1  ORF type:complete len:68 (-),score=6.93 TRINITY_DN15843_c0_g1_i1:1-204(-)